MFGIILKKSIRILIDRGGIVGIMLIRQYQIRNRISLQKVSDA